MTNSSFMPGYAAPKVLFKKTLLAGAVALSGILFLQMPASAAAGNAEMPKQEQHAVDNAQPTRVEAQIKELRDKLDITTAQDAKWQEVADAMRDTAKEVRTKLTDRSEKVKTSKLTAVDELRSYQDLQLVQYNGVKRLLDPFTDLYATMSADQKKNADELFEEPKEQAQASGAATGAKQ